MRIFDECCCQTDVRFCEECGKRRRGTLVQVAKTSLGWCRVGFPALCVGLERVAFLCLWRQVLGMLADFFLWWILGVWRIIPGGFFRMATPAWTHPATVD
ncbi:MAG: hypothetical protein CL799_13165 [Chromatiales bacterium]|nr:hypothetical protein [Chromatiales bacterium]